MRDRPFSEHHSRSSEVESVDCDTLLRGLFDACGFTKNRRDGSQRRAGQKAAFGNHHAEARAAIAAATGLQASSVECSRREAVDVSPSVDGRASQLTSGSLTRLRPTDTGGRDLMQNATRVFKPFGEILRIGRLRVLPSQLRD